MKRYICCISTLFILLCVMTKDIYAQDAYKRTMKQDLLCLMLGYKGYIKDVEADDKGRVYLLMESGEKIPYDNMTGNGEINTNGSGDPQDTLQEKYPLEMRNTLMEENINPGRCRCYKLFNEVYGRDRKAIEKQLQSTSFIMNNVLFSKSNGAAEALSNVARELKPYMKDSAILSAVYPGSGTYNYRIIAGTGNLSPHAYGIAIDLARDSRDYWQWAIRSEGEKRISTYPSKLVKIFENNGFIWGGKWWHFDILHFEYRPEIILKSRYFSESDTSDWYEGAPIDNMYVNECIKKINNAIE